MRPVLRIGLLKAAAVETIEELATVTCEAIAIPSTALVRIWLFDRDRAALRLCASTGSPIGGGSYNRVDGAFAVISSGVGKLGRIAATGDPLIARGLRGDEEWLANPNWIARQAVRSFIGLPLIADAEVVGVLASFDREVTSDERLDELQFIAAFVAARLRALRTTRETRVPDLSRALDSVLTRADLRTLERRSIQAALIQTSGKIFGPNGAASLLQMKPTTLISRIKALGLSTTS